MNRRAPRVAPGPPRALAQPHVEQRHGDLRQDGYHWMQQREDQEVLRHIRAENAYTASVLRPHEELIQGLYREMRRRHLEELREVPERIGEYSYSRRTPRGSQYWQIRRRRDAPGAREELLLDLNLLAAQRRSSYLKVGDLQVSPDHALLALTLDLTGDERFTLLVLRPGGDQEPLLEVEGSSPALAWAADSGSLVHCALDSSGRPHRALLRRLDRPGDYALLYEEPDPGFFVSCEGSRSGRYIFITSSNNITDEVRFVEARQPAGPPRLVRPRVAGVEYSVVHQDRHFYIVTNEGAANYRLVRAPVDQPSVWKELLPHRDDALLESAEAFEDHIVVLERRMGLQRLRIFDRAGGHRHFVEFPEPSYHIGLHRNPEYRTRFYRFTYSSPLTPGTVYDYDMGLRFKRPRQVAEVKGGFDPANYSLERITARAPDGVRIPMTLLYRRGTRRDGKNPLYIYGYGSYGLNASPEFSAERFSLVDRGFVFAIAHVRGGMELGRAWYEDGKLLKKKNTFNDFIACTEHLIRERWTSPDRVAAAGASAGGMLMGAVANMRPDLYRTMVAHVPFVDVLNSMLDPGQPLTVFEYDEWGDPNIERFYRYIKSYSPYDNVGAKAYPNMLVLASYNDPRVPFWEAAKWVARLRAHKTDDNQLLLRTFMHAGHAGRSGRFEELKELALEYAFICVTLGIQLQLDDAKAP